MKKAMKINTIRPDLTGVCINLNVFPWVNSAARLYMCGNMIPKSVITAGMTTRKLVSGFEKQYGETARKIIAPSHMTVEDIFYVESLEGGGKKTDGWTSLFVIFKNDEKNMYDMLELPRYNTQNTYIGFEYVYDKQMIDKLLEGRGATFRKGDIFGYSPRLSPSGEWQFGMETLVAAMSSHMTEEDGIVITESYAKYRMRCMFKLEREFSWNEEEYVPLYLYGTKEKPRPFPEIGEKIRPDGIVMGFRRRLTENALVSLTNKALTIPDRTYDVLLYAPPDATVMQLEVLSDRMKNQANNRSTEFIEQRHNSMLTNYERAHNQFCGKVIRWYEQKVYSNHGDIPITPELDNFIRMAYMNHTRHPSTNRINPLLRAVKRTRLKDWNVKILLRQEIEGRSKFKLSGMNGDKGVAVKVIPDAHAPMYPDGTRAEIIVNNTPAFRRQIYSMLMEMSINFINLQIHREVKEMRLAGEYDKAFERLMEFYETGFPEFGELVRGALTDKAAQHDHVDFVAKDQISVHVRADTQLFGVDIIRALRKKFPYKPQKVTFVNALGEKEESENPVLISSMYYMLLDKFGTDMSSQALPKSNLYGMPARLNEQDKYGSWHRDVWNRNTGETEGRLKANQGGAKEVVKDLAMAYSPEARINSVQRILRADDPFEIKQIMTPEEYGTNRAVQMAASMLSDSGYVVREQRPDERESTEL